MIDNISTEWMFQASESKSSTLMSCYTDGGRRAGDSSLVFCFIQAGNCIEGKEPGAEVAPLMLSFVLEGHIVQSCSFYRCSWKDNPEQSTVGASSHKTCRDGSTPPWEQTFPSLGAQSSVSDQDSDSGHLSCVNTSMWPCLCLLPL